MDVVFLYKININKDIKREQNALRKLKNQKIQL